MPDKVSGMALHYSRSVRWFTASSLMESIGDAVARNALPLVAVGVLGANSFFVGILNSLGLVSFLLLSMPLGSLADRWSHPATAMRVSSLIRAVLVLTALGLWAVGRLHGAPGIVTVLAIALISGVADVIFSSGQGLLVPRLVEQQQIRSVFGQVQSSAQVGGVAGAALLAALVAVVAAPASWGAAALAYVTSAVFQGGIKEKSAPPAAGARAPIWAHAAEGMRYLMRQSSLRKITVANTLHNAAVMSANTLLPVIALSRLGVSFSAYAGIGLLGAGSAVLGSLLATRISQRLGLRTTRLLAGIGVATGVLLVMGAGGVAMVLPGPTEVWLGINSILSGMWASIAIVAGSDLPAKLTPAEKLGAVMGAQRTLAMGIMPVAALASGLLGTWCGLGAATLIWFGLIIVSLVPCMLLGRDLE